MICKICDGDMAYESTIQNAWGTEVNIFICGQCGFSEAIDEVRKREE